MSSITLFFLFIPLLAFILLAINLIFAPHNPYQEKNSSFNCGFSSFLGQNRSEFNISFFIFAILFLLFDLEVLLIYPYVVSAYNNDLYGLIVMLVFFILLTLGFVFELGKGALKITSRQDSLYNKPLSTESIVYIGNCSNLVFTNYTHKSIRSANIKVTNSLQQQRFYSTGIDGTSTNLKGVFNSIKSEFKLQYKTNYICDRDFKQWFVGLVDGEGNFDINSTRPGKFVFAFRVRIKLHIDDLPLLNYIKERLNCGYMEINKTNACLVFSKHDWLKNIILPIFDEFPLNSIKYLNFIDFKKAFYLYINSTEYGNSRIKKSELIGNEIFLLKANMNFKRTNFKMPLNHSVNITPYWLLGFIEGEGCFHAARKYSRGVDFSLNVTLVERPLLLKIHEYLNRLDPINNLFFDKQLQKARGVIVSRGGVYDYLRLRSETHKPLTCLSISDTCFCYKFFIPFLDKLVFLSKKKYDYLDWRLIVFINYWGLNRIETGKTILNNINKGINNNRLSTHGSLKHPELNLYEQIDKISSTLYIDIYGLMRELHTNKLVRQRYLIIAVPLEQVAEDNSIKFFGQKYTLVLFIEKMLNLKVLPINFFIFYGTTSCRSFFNISDSKIQSIFDKNSSVEYNNTYYYLFRFNTNII